VTALGLSLGTRLPWMAEAACAGRWYFTEGTIAEQKAVCRGCPVRNACAEFGLEEPTTDKTDTTVWGGLSPEERRELRRQRRRLQVIR